jgi:tetratricopeptide (TPR) repeat protein
MKSPKNTFLLRLALASCIILGLKVNANAQNIKDGIQAQELLKFDEARAMYNKVLAKEPGNAKVYYYLGNIAFHNFQFDSAKYLFDKGVQLNGNEPLNYIGKGLLALKDKNYDLAKQDYDKALALSSNKDPYVMQQITESMWTQQERKFADFAFDLMNKAVALDKKNQKYVVSLGDADRLRGESSLGLAEYKKAAEADPKLLLAQLRIGESYAKVPNYDAAEEVFNKIIATDPNYPPVYPDLAEMFALQKGKIDKALVSYKKFLSLVGTGAAERFHYAYFLYVTKDYKGALDELNKVVQGLPDNISVLRLKGYCEYETGAYDAALVTMQKLFTIAKGDNIIGKDYGYYGKILSKNNKDSLALNYLGKGIKDDSTSVELYDLMAQGYTKMKMYKEAADIMEKKLAKTKANPAKIDYYTLGTYYFALGKYAKADTNFAMVNIYYPTYAVGYLYRARANAYSDTLTKKTYKAKRFYEKFIELALPDAAKNKSELVESYLYLGAYYYNQKDMAKAKEYFGKVKEIDPGNKQNNEYLKFIANQKK